jgi:hypothetical protein
MQPSAKAEGKPEGKGGGKSAGERAGGTGGMQPSRKREGKYAGEGEGKSVNCTDARCLACGGLAAPAARWGVLEGWGGCV